jgi:4-hydroxy-tetrahydrodipicolinate synthase
MVKLASGDNFSAARELHLKYLRVFNDIFVEPNPVPVKSLMKNLGLIESEEVRLPLSPLLPENAELVSRLAADFPLD